MPGGTRDTATAGYEVGMVAAGLADHESKRQPSRAGGRGWPGNSTRRLTGAVALLIPVAAALAVNGYELGRPSLWRDEAYTLDAAGRSVPQIFRLLSHTDAVNGSYYLFMHPVIAFLGASEAALRLPSVLAMAVAVAFTAAIGRRLARAAALPAPALTGMLAGLLLVVAPQATRYAQEARAYALVTMFATMATYLLLRALEQGGWRWWATYGAAVVAMGLLNLLSLVLLAAHAATLLIVRARLRGQQFEPAAALPGQPRSVPLGRWLAAAGAAAAVLSPLIATGASQSGQIGWLTRPGLPDIRAMVVSFAGSGAMLPLVALLALGGLAASLAPGRRGPLDVATVAAPWLILPPVVLITVSQVHPIYDFRYVVYCLPALALLAAGGLAWLTRLALATRLGRGGGGLAWLPAVVVLAGLTALAVTPQLSLRLPGSRPDNLRRVSAVVAAYERPGDAVVYLPANKRVVGMGYPAPFRRLWDVALAESPVAAGNLIGANVPIPVLRQRLTRVSRLWVVTGGLGVLRAPKTAMQRAEVALLGGFHPVHTWRAGLIALRLYAR